MEQPVVFNEVLNLLSVGVNPDYVKFGTTSMESDKFITVCEQTNGQSNVIIIDLYQGNNVQKRPISAEAAIMNPVSKVIALRAGNQLQIFNMELRAKMKSHQISESVVYWRWISPNMIGLVTATSIYHWSIEGDSVPSKIFERNASIGTGNQIIGYEVSEDSNWCLLIGIAQGEGGAIVGNMQLYSKEKKVSQVLNGYAGSFTTLNLPGRTDPAQVLCFAGSKAGGPLQLFIMEVGRDKDAPGGVFRLPPQPIPFPPEAVADFPVSMIDTSDGLVYIISKMGFLYLFDIYTGKPLYRCRISQDTVFVSTINTKSRGILGITRKGQVLHIALNKKTLAPYIVNTLHDPQLAISLAGRIDLPGVEELYFTEFNRLLSVNDIQGAAKLASASPQGILRTPQTIQRFQAMPPQPGQPQPALQYFSVLLEKGGLNKHESLELARPVLQQGRGQLLEKWLTENKLECSEELGDMIAQSDTNMALSVYLRAQVPEKVINCFIQRGEYEKIVAYALQTGYKCDYTFMLQSLVRANPAGALDFATKLANAENGSLIDIAAVVDIFMQVNRIQETTAFLLEALKQNRAEDARLQTRLLEINLVGGSPQVAEAILSNNMFTHYDRQRVGQLCEKASLFQRALEHYTEFDDIKRVIVNTHAINPEFLITYFSSLTSEVSMKLINILLSTNLRQNLNVVVQIATKYAEQLGTNLLIETFEKYKSYDGLYFFLGAIVNFSQDAEVHYRYIEAATKMGQFKEVERVCRDSTVYDPIKVKDFLKESKLQDPRPLIHVCDRYEYIEELTQYLYSNQLLKYIEVYATKVSPQKTPKVIGKLLDLDCNEDYIRSLLNAVPLQQCPVEELVNEVEKRNRLRLLQPYLELLVQQGNTETATHNAIGKIYITLNKDPQNFLTNNQFYDPLVVGKFCEKLDPHLAYLAYRRNGGQCDAELIRITKENGLYKELARYLVEKQDLDLWAKVLVKVEGEGDTEKENISRGLLIDQVVQTALAETKNADEVSTTVRAFMNADLPNELIELLERIVLQNTDFSNNKNLQNLLILTAIKANQEKVMDYINRLDNYDGPDIAKIAINEQYKLYEEAFVIYKKTGENNVDAIDVLLDYIVDMERAYEFADRCNEPGVWSRLAEKQLSSTDGFNESIASFIKAQDASSYANVISKGEQEGKYEEMIPYLKMARQIVKEQLIDTTLIYALSKTKKYHDLEEFISSPNIAQIQEIGEKCYNEQLYDAAKILFRNINNNAKLSICYVRTGNYREAVDAATKANSINTWKEICYACIDVGEFRLANLCGLHIIVHPDHLEELIQNYEKLGYWSELIKLLEQGIGLDGTHVGIFTELGILYSKYLPDKLMEHIKIFHGRINISKILRFCEKALLWDHMVYLYKEDNQYDNAVRIMIEHSSSFNNETFLDCVQKVRNHEIHYKAIQFYIECFPLELNRLLTLLIPNLDHARVIHQVRKVNKDYLLLISDYLHEIQKENLNAINDTINEIYIANEEYSLLKESIETYNNFDQISLAQKLEKHELLEFRRLSALLYQKNKRFTQSIKISKDDKMYKDIITTIALSKDTSIIEDTIQYFIDLNEKECIVAILYQCYQYIEPDYIMEIGWKYDLIDFTMPYMIQYMRNSNRKIKELHERCQLLEEKNKQSIQGSTIETQNANLGNPLGGGVMQIAATAFNTDVNAGYMMPQQQMGGVGMMAGNVISPMTMSGNMGMSPPAQMPPQGSASGFNNTFNNNQNYRF